jgi:hypothetical protein
MIIGKLINMPPASTSGVGQSAPCMKGCPFFRHQLTMIRNALTVVELLAMGMSQNVHRTTGSIPNDLRGVPAVERATATQ